MKKGGYKNEEIEKTMDSINQLQRAEAPPFFYTRLEAKLEGRYAQKPSLLMTFTRPAVSFATLSLLLVLNVAVIFRYVQKTGKTNLTQPSTSGIQQFAEAYEMGGSSVFTDKTNDQ